MSSALSVSYGWSSGGRIRRSLTSHAISGEREAITYSKRVCWDVIPRVLNCASICRNHTVGSVGQNGGNFMLTAARVGGGAGAAAASVASAPLTCMTGLSGVAMGAVAEGCRS